VSQYQKGKTNLDFTEARDGEWQWHQLGRMQVCTSLQSNNHASTPLLFFTGRMPFLPPNQQRQSSKVYIVFCSVAAAESSCMVDSGVSPSAAVSRSSEPTSVDYSTTEYLPQSAEGDDVAVEQSMIDRDASVSERPSVTTPYDLVEGSVDCQVGIWTSFNLLYILTKQLNI